MAVATSANSSRLPRELWSDSSRSVWAVSCSAGDHRDFCETIEVREPNKIVHDGQTDYDDNYEQLNLRWKRTRPGVGPAAILEGRTGGSAGCVGYYVVTFASGAPWQKLWGCHLDETPIVSANGLPHFNLGFSIEGFAGVPDAGTSVVGLPMHWTGRRMELDLAAVMAPRFGFRWMDQRRHAMGVELRKWRAAGGEMNAQFFTVITTQTLLKLMLSGHADQAHTMLIRGWPSGPSQAGGLAASPEAFWSGLCKRVISEPLWTELAMHRISQAEMVEAAAAGPAIGRR